MMEAPPTMEVVLEALNALHRPKDAESHKQASTWLDGLTNSPHGWKIAHELMALNVSEEASYFAANTLRSKVLSSFAQLPEEDRVTVRDSLIAYCTTQKNLPKTVATQLQLALADVILQMSTWTDAPSHLIQRYGNDTDHWFFLLNLFTYMAEELTNEQLKLGQNRRNGLSQDLENAALAFQQFLLNTLNKASGNTEVLVLIMKCLTSWLGTYCLSADILEKTDILTLPINILLKAVESPEPLHSAAVDCVCEAFDSLTNEEKCDHPVCLKLFRNVKQLVGPYNATSSNSEKSKSFCKLFSEMAENLLHLVLSPSPPQEIGSLDSIELVLLCMGNEDHEVVDITFTFWSEFCNRLVNEEEVVKAKFYPIIERLIKALHAACQLDEKEVDFCDEEADFNQFRDSAGKLVEDIIEIVTPVDVLTVLFNSDILSKPWPSIEAAFYITFHLGEHLPETEPTIVPKIVDSILKMGQDVPISLQSTALLAMGQMTDWINQHPDRINPSMEHILKAMHIQKLAISSSNAFKLLCQACSTHLCGQMQQLVQFAQTLQLPPKATVEILKGVSSVVSKLPPDQASSTIRHLCELQINPLSKLLGSGDCQINRENTESDPKFWLERLAIIFRNASPKAENYNTQATHPCKGVVLEIWPYLSRCFQKHGSEPKIIEQCCRCLRYMIRCLGKHCSDLLTQLVPELVQLYRTHPHSCCLYVGGVIVDEMGDDLSCREAFLNMYKELCEPALQQLNSPDGLINNPDTVDDFFRISRRFTEHMPIEYVERGFLEPVMQCALRAVHIEHKEAFHSAKEFLETFINKGTYGDGQGNSNFLKQKQLIDGALIAYGQPMVEAVMRASINAPDTYYKEDLADVIYLLVKHYNPYLVDWMYKSLKAIHMTSPGGTVGPTDQQISKFIEELMSCSDVEEILTQVDDIIEYYL